MHLIDHHDSLLVSVDAQPRFYADGTIDGPDRQAADAALERAAWLAKVATHLGVPAVLTEEDAPRNGPTEPSILEALPGAPVFAKGWFGLAACPDILAAVQATHRNTVIMVGFETDVCVVQSAIGLAALGMRSVIVSDATFSPCGMHAAGLERARGAGIELLTVKGLYYEWTRSLACATDVYAAVGLPPFRP